jgi:hypothetical protein
MRLSKAGSSCLFVPLLLSLNDEDFFHATAHPDH